MRYVFPLTRGEIRMLKNIVRGSAERLAAMTSQQVRDDADGWDGESDDRENAREVVGWTAEEGNAP